MASTSRSSLPYTPESSTSEISEDEHGYSTPQTTPRKTGITALHNSSPWHQDQARCFLQDLNNFIALGCLVSDRTVKTQADAARWTEVFQIPADAGLDEWDSVLEDFVTTGWIRVFVSSALDHTHTIFRIYILAADAGHLFINRGDKAAKSRYPAWRALVEAVDTSPRTWAGDYNGSKQSFQLWADADVESLYWMFNTIPSPSPDPETVPEIFRKQAMIEVLDPTSNLQGLKTKLYPYQRRSTGLMLQRESENRLYHDPRFEMRTAPDSSRYYYNARDFAFRRSPMRYEAGKGGILAETMGLGKTVMTLALIVSTRGVLPRLPVEFSHTKTRKTIGSLTDMCISATQLNAIPWKTYLDDSQRETAAAQRLENSIFSYEIPQIPIRLNRTTTIPPPKKKSMAATTIVVVPRNLCSQWQSEIEKHVEPGILNVLIMEDLKKDLPSSEELRKYDVILFSRNRFEQESRDGSDEQGRRFSKTPLTCACPYIGATRTRDCTCLRTDDLYSSPLKVLHFLRIIIDEGHSFSSTNSMAAMVAERLVTADHRWVVSGTPAKDLLGVEMDLFNVDRTQEDVLEEERRTMLLSQRKEFSGKDDERAAVQNLGALVGHFLQIRPWATGKGESGATWDEYIYRHEDLRKRTYTAFSKALRQTLDAVVIKTRPEDVERDIDLPPLTYETIKLKPSYYDRITSNLFTLVLTSNAVTSERTDKDYLFHKDSTKFRVQLIGNLRQSAFLWTGFSRQNVLDSIGNAERYLKKDGITCNQEDRDLLEECIKTAKTILDDSGWTGMSATHELGVFVRDWPMESVEHWTMDGSNPMMTGAHQVADAQDYVHSRLGLTNLDLNLSGEGIKAMVRARARGKEETDSAEGRAVANVSKSGIPASSVNGEPSKRRTTPTKRKATSDPSSIPPSKKRRASTSTAQGSPSVPLGPPPTLPPDSPLRKTRLIGTVSAKASHLLTSILSHYQTEKSLVFFTSENSAWYLAQCLEVLHIPHLIYARGLAASKKSEYIVKFNESPVDRVMLMDVNQAAFGLNLSSASRVYFINPVLRPGVEAQAVKRAHRIGQTREVKVQTLVLEGTWEEGMWERSRRMTREEQKVKAVEEDEGVKGVVRSMRLMDLTVAPGEGKMAPLGEAQEVFCRQGWEEWGEGKWWRNRKKIVEEKLTVKRDEAVEQSPKPEGGRKKKKRKQARESEGTATVSVAGPSSPPLGIVQRMKSRAKRPKTVGFAVATDEAGPDVVRVSVSGQTAVTKGVVGQNPGLE
ncbi:SNF2 family N-terminal domain-containing protein 11 [Elsinoe fawcettii]|nr:SNF2 family N-terminal domain-containing protein 11 [Elsinoe fawcettii]